LDEAGGGDGAFDAAPEVEECPAVAAGHVLHFHATEGGEVEDEGVEGGTGGDERCVAGAGAGIVVEAAEDAPGIGGEAVADAEGCGLDAVEEVANAGVGRGRVEAVEEDVLEPERRGAEGFGRGVGAEAGQEVEESGGLVGVGFFGDGIDAGAGEAEEVFEAFGIAAEPKEVLGGAAGEVGGEAFEFGRWGCDGEGSGSGFGVGGEDPNVLGAVAEGQGGGDGGGGAVEAGKAAGDRAVVGAVEDDEEPEDDGAGGTVDDGGEFEGDWGLGDEIVGAFGE
jgi:hypothetical protein